MARFVALFVALFVAVAPQVRAQVQAPVTKERVIKAEGHVKVFPSGGRMGMIVTAPSIVSESWRIWILAPALTEDVVIRDVARGQEVGRILADRAARGAWSPYLSPLTVFLDLPKSAQAEVQLIGIPKTAVETQTPVGANNLVRINQRDMTFDLRQLIEAIGQLTVVDREVGGAGDFFTYCTAFMISAGTALTAEHCVGLGLEGKISQLALGFVDAEAPDGVGRHDVALIAKSRGLDVALLSVSPPAKTHAFFEIADGEPNPAAELLILQHPAGEPLSVSNDEDCVVVGAYFDGPRHIVDRRVNRLPKVSFGHGCDTAESSSGAPVIERDSLRLVGLHQAGYAEGDPQVNRALRRDRLAEFLASLDLDTE